jgi:hypothetical protein
MRDGGAATAILAYLAKSTPPDPAILKAASASLMGYAVGVFFGAVSIWCSAQAAAQFGYYWESVMDKDKSGQGYFPWQGDRWLFHHRTSFWLSIFFFLGATIAIAGVLVIV